MSMQRSLRFSMKTLYPVWAVIALCLIGIYGNGWAAEPKDNWTLNLKDVDIHAFIEQVSSITGENFAVDPQVKGKVTVVSTSPLNKEAVNELFLSVLRVNGYNAVTSGNITRIVPLANARGAGIASPMQRQSGEQIITRVVPVKNANVEEAVKILKPLMSSAGYLEGSVYSNALIISDYADNVAQVSKTLDSLDRDGDADIEIIPIKQGWVDNLVPLIENLSPMQLSDGKSRNRLKIIADERSNSIIVKGSLRDRQKIRHLVQELDQATPNSGDFQQIKLQYADAKEVADLLRGLVFAKKNEGAGGAAFPGAAPTAGALPAAATLGVGNSAAATALNNLFPSSAGASSGETQGPGEQSFIQADTALNALLVRAEPATMNNIRMLVRQMDVRRPQVHIEAAIVEITSDQSQQLGVQFAAGNGAQPIHTGIAQFSNNETGIGTLLSQLGTTATSGLGDGTAIALGTAKFDVLIQALASMSGANLLSTPSVTTLDNTEARIMVGQNVPFKTGTVSTIGSGIANPFTTIEREDIGITLRVLPQIHEGNLVRLTISQEVSSIAPATPDNSGAADIITNKRTIETKVLAEDGETVVLGGLMEDDKTDSASKIPLLGDIPFLGALFRNTSNDVSKRNLLIFLRPTVLRSREQMAEVTQRKYGRLYDPNLGYERMADADGQTAPVPPVQTIFNPAQKTLPWLLPEAQELPWLRKRSEDVAPQMQTYSPSTTTALPLQTLPDPAANIYPPASR